MAAPDVQGTRFFICCDGTGEEPTGNSLNDTNPYRLAVLAATHDGNVKQTVGYQQGIGTLDEDSKGKFESAEDIWDQALGDGLDYNSFKVCEWLVQQGCTENDEVVLCGFSRGSFTQRIVAEFISDAGLLRKAPKETDQDYTLRAWVAYYTWFLAKAGPSLPPAQLERAKAGLEKSQQTVPQQQYNRPFRPRSLALALFDTVATTGLPGQDGTDISEIFNNVDALSSRWKWLTEDLPSGVSWVRQALSRGEHRKLFPALLMRETAGTSVDLAQRWFPGAHTAVGGGGGDLNNDVASLDPLAFILGELQGGGIFLFDVGRIQQMVPLIANESTIGEVTALPTSVKGIYEYLGTANRMPGTVPGTTNEEIQTPETAYQQTISQAGAAIDVPCPSKVIPQGNSAWQTYLIHLAQQPAGQQPHQLPAIPRDLWIASASTEADVAEYKYLTGIEGDEDFEPSQASSQDGGANDGPKFPSPAPEGVVGQLKSWLQEEL